KEQRAQIFERQQRRQIRQRYAGEAEITQARKRPQLAEIFDVTLQVKGFELRAARDRTKRETDCGAGEGKFLQAVRNVAQAVDIPDDRTFHIEPLQAGKVTQAFEILHGVSPQLQFDVAPAVPEPADLLHLRIALGRLHANPVAGFVQRTPGIESKRHVRIDVAATLLIRDVFAARVRAGAVRHHRGPDRSKFNLTSSKSGDTNQGAPTHGLRV